MFCVKILKPTIPSSNFATRVHSQIRVQLLIVKWQMNESKIFNEMNIILWEADNLHISSSDQDIYLKDSWG